MNPPQPILTIDNLNRTYLHLSDILPAVERYRIIYISKCKDVVINIDSKVVKCIFDDCEKLTVLINNDIIGCIEFIRVFDSYIVSHQSNINIPYIQCDLCETIMFDIKRERQTYVCSQSMNIVLNGNKYLPTSMFDEQRQIEVDGNRINYTRINNNLNNDFFN